MFGYGLATQLKVSDPAAALGYGAGQINPTAAVDPGLVYDVAPADYIHFLCHEGYSEKLIKLITNETVENCSALHQFGGHDALNYPSMYLQLDKTNASISATFNRAVTNVGPFDSVYKATVKADEGLNISVTPSILRFKRFYQRKFFQVNVTRQQVEKLSAIQSASLEWVNIEYGHRVRSPIVVAIPAIFGTD